MLTIENKNLFVGTDGYILKVVLEKEGEILAAEKHRLNISAGEKDSVKIGLEVPENGGEYVLTASAVRTIFFYSSRICRRKMSATRALKFAPMVVNPMPMSHQFDIDCGKFVQKLSLSFTVICYSRTLHEFILFVKNDNLVASISVNRSHA